MGFSDQMLLQAWRRSEGRCECTRSTQGHAGRCDLRLIREARGYEKGLGGWEAGHITAGGPDTSSNCEILCIPCQKKTRTYGGRKNENHA